MLRVRELREAAVPPLTQEHLAHLAGVAVRTVARAESGEELSTRTLGRIAEALGVPLKDLFGEAA